MTEVNKRGDPGICKTTTVRSKVTGVVYNCLHTTRQREESTYQICENEFESCVVTFRQNIQRLCGASKFLEQIKVVLEGVFQAFQTPVKTNKKENLPIALSWLRCSGHSCNQ